VKMLYNFKKKLHYSHILEQSRQKHFTGYKGLMDLIWCEENKLNPLGVIQNVVFFKRIES